MPSRQTKAATEALTGSPIQFEDLASSVPNAAGLYAFHANSTAWVELGLGDPPDDRPLYVGKAEQSLASRDVRTHFGTGRTGSSTLRRSLAALLAKRMRLRAIPRNPDKPSHFSNYKLTDAGERKLTEWMQTNLSLTYWKATPATKLAVVELEVLADLLPPLNVQGVRTDWTAELSAARKRLADQARKAAGLS